MARAARPKTVIRLRRVEPGHDGDDKPVQEGVYGWRFPLGPAYRVYVAEDGDTVVVILGGGDNSTQDQDIDNAKSRWREYPSHA